MKIYTIADHLITIPDVSAAGLMHPVKCIVSSNLATILQTWPLSNINSNKTEGSMERKQSWIRLERKISL